MTKRAFVTGVTGQDGHYLCELLIEKGYDVYGLVRHTSQKPKIPKGITVVEGDIREASVVSDICGIDPAEIYNLAAMSHVGHSFQSQVSTFETNAIGCLNILEAAKLTEAKFYQASTSEIFGASEPPQSEATPFYPKSPYGIAKLAAYWATVNHREAYGTFACNGILFNHESPIRGYNFVTQKICTGVARIALGKQSVIELGNLDATRDWGHAKDFVMGMWLMLQQDKPDDYVLATGVSYTIRDLLDRAFEVIGVSSWEGYVTQNPKFMRPSEVPDLRGDPSKAKKVLGWKPKYTFEKLIIEMVEAAKVREA